MSLTTSPAGLIFDLDGTLLDTEPLYTLASQKVLDAYGEIYTPELKRRVMGGDSHTSAQTVIDEFNLPLTSTEYLALREHHLTELFADCPEIDGAATFVTQVKQLGLPLGLATSSHQHLRDLKLGNKPWGNFFDATVCGDNPALTRGKPAPDIFLLCAETLGVQANACVAFEDSRNGVAAARAAGMEVVGMLSPYVLADDLAEATVIIEHFSELEGWLRGLSRP